MPQFKIYFSLNPDVDIGYQKSDSGYFEMKAQNRSTFVWLKGRKLKLEI